MPSIVAYIRKLVEVDDLLEGYFAVSHETSLDDDVDNPVLEIQKIISFTKGLAIISISKLILAFSTHHQFFLLTLAYYKIIIMLMKIEKAHLLKKTR